MVSTITEKQQADAKVRMIRDLTSAINLVTMDDWILLKTRLKDIEQVRAQLEVMEVEN